MVIPSHVYVDLDVVNNDLTIDISALALKFEETRTSQYIEGDSADYLCSIIRFCIQTGSSLPVSIPKIEFGQQYVNETECATTLKSQAYIIMVKIMITNTSHNPLFFHQSDTAPTPAPA